SPDADRAAFRVTNSGAEALTYTITFTLLNDSGQAMDTVRQTVASVGPGQSVTRTVERADAGAAAGSGAAARGGGRSRTGARDRGPARPRRDLHGHRPGRTARAADTAPGRVRLGIPGLAQHHRLRRGGERAVRHGDGGTGGPGRDRDTGTRPRHHGPARRRRL